MHLQFAFVPKVEKSKSKEYRLNVKGERFKGDLRGNSFHTDGGGNVEHAARGRCGSGYNFNV